MRLAYLYNVSESTVKRDLIFLSSCIPIETKSGNGGGVFLNLEFESRKQYLTLNEKALLERLSKTLSTKDRVLMRTIINKFSIPNGEQNYIMYLEKESVQDNGSQNSNKRIHSNNDGAG